MCTPQICHVWSELAEALQLLYAKTQEGGVCRRLRRWMTEDGCPAIHAMSSASQVTALAAVLALPGFQFGSAFLVFLWQIACAALVVMAIYRRFCEA